MLIKELLWKRWHIAMPRSIAMPTRDNWATCGRILVPALMIKAESVDGEPVCKMCRKIIEKMPK